MRAAKRRRPWVRVGLLLGSWAVLPWAIGEAGCASIRITDPDHTATELFLMNVASDLAINQISAVALRDRRVYLDPSYLISATQPSESTGITFGAYQDKQQQYMIGALRSKLLLEGVRLVRRPQDADVVMEVRSQGISVDRTSYLLGLPSSSLGGVFTGGFAGTTPELAIVKTEKQHGFASVAYIAYWRDTGEVVAASGPFVGRTIRDDYWFFGYGPQTTGNIPPAQPAPIEGGSSAEADRKAATPPPAEAKPPEPPPKPRPTRASK